MNNDLISRRTERALLIVDRLTDNKAINIRERGTLRRAILLPERPQGEWIATNRDVEFYNEVFKCSVCGVIDFLSNFCPNCGARMKGGEEE